MSQAIVTKDSHDSCCNIYVLFS